MSDETIELTEVQAIINGLSSPTDEQFVQAVRSYSDGAVASAAAKLALAGGGGGSLPAWWTVDSTLGSESFEVGEHRTLFGDGSEIVVSADGGAFTEYRSDEDDDENTGKVFVGIDDSGGDFFGEFTAWTGQDTAAERRVTLRTITSNDDQGNVYVLRLSTDTSNFLVLMDENGDRFEVGPTGAVTISPSDDSATALQIRSDGDLLDAQNVAEEWGLLVGGDGRTRIFSDPSVDGHTFDVTGGPNGAAGFRFLNTDSALMEDLLQVWDDDNNQVMQIGPTGAVTISPSDDVIAQIVNAAAGQIENIAEWQLDGTPLAWLEADGTPGGTLAGGSLPAGWTQDGDPANVFTNGGTLQFSHDVDNEYLLLEQQNIEMTEPVAGESIFKVSPGTGVVSAATGVPCFVADSANGATTAFEANSLPLTLVADPSDPQDAATKNYVDTTAELIANKDQPSGYAGLDGGGLLAVGEIPDLSVTYALVVAGVPDATGAASGDVLTADGIGGFAWVTP